MNIELDKETKSEEIQEKRKQESDIELENSNLKMPIEEKNTQMPLEIPKIDDEPICSNETPTIEEEPIQNKSRVVKESEENVQSGDFEEAMHERSHEN